MDFPPSGEQFHISSGDHNATIVEVGGGVRRYDVGDRPVFQDYDMYAMCDAAHGAPLIPWPNRLRDGRYLFDGQQFQVALTEPEKRNAIHGLLRWRPWRVDERTDHRVVMRNRLFPMMGYPFTLECAIEYSMSDAGLMVRTTVANIGDDPCPYGSGQHPYLSPGDGLIDDCEVSLSAATRIDTDDERQLPTGRKPVEETPYDLRTASRLGNRAIDYAYTDLIRDEHGLAWVRMRGADDRTAAVWVDESYPFLEIFTADTLAPDRKRRGLGVEPMTCAPDAFNNGDGLLVLQPGQAATTTWGATLL
jgi:aldose 1-epimerase